jgi:chromosome segregation ATPase
MHVEADERKARALELLERVRLLSDQMLESLRVRKAIEARRSCGNSTAGEREELARALQEVEQEYEALSAADARLMDELQRVMVALTRDEPTDS